jgi:uncharacterized membrane protein YesL
MVIFLKELRKSDPDTPTIKEELCGIYKEEFLRSNVK